MRKWNISKYKFSELTTELIEHLRDDNSINPEKATHVGLDVHTGVKTGVKIEWVETNITDYLGHYDSVQDKITIYWNKFVGHNVIADTLIHELLHAILYKTSEKNEEEIVKELTFMIMRYKGFYKE